MAHSKIVDLFAGAGGFSLGAYAAGFSPVLAIDIDPDLTASHKTNFPTTKTLLGDLGSIDPRAALRAVDIAKNEVAGILGGPPCQGYSAIGKRDPNDERNGLVSDYFRFVHAVQPLFFVMENVPGILEDSHRFHLEDGLDLVAAKYAFVGPVLLDAADFGAATTRERVIVIGYRPDRMNPLTERDILFRRKTRSSVREAIQDVPSPDSAATDAEGHSWAAYPQRKMAAPLSQYANRARTAPPKGLSTMSVRERLRAGTVSGCRATAHTAAVVERFAKLQPGRRDSVSRFPRLKWDAPSPTLRAGTGKDRGSYQSVRPIHPEANRVITVREAARLQGFPDWFQFHPTIWHSFRMIGNSVSPLMAEAILGAIASCIGLEAVARHITSSAKVG